MTKLSMNNSLRFSSNKKLINERNFYTNGYLNILFSNVVLVFFILLFSYGIYYSERMESRNKNNKNEALATSHSIYQIYKSSCNNFNNQNNSKCMVDKSIKNLLVPLIGKDDSFLVDMNKSVKDKLDYIFNKVKKKELSFSQSVFFIGSVVTTVGYGYYSPKSEFGRLICCFVIFFTLPHILILNSIVSDLMTSFLQRMGLRYIIRVSNTFLVVREKISKRNKPYSYVPIEIDGTKCLAFLAVYKEEKSIFEKFFVKRNKAKFVQSKIFGLGTNESVYSAPILSLLINTNLEGSFSESESIKHNSNSHMSEQDMTIPTIKIEKRTKSLNHLSMRRISIKKNYPKWVMIIIRNMNRIRIAQILVFFNTVWMIFLIIVVLPSMFFMLIEDTWTLLDSYYVSIVTVSTVGLGDLAPGLEILENKYKAPFYATGMFIYFILGSTLFSVIYSFFENNFATVSILTY